MSDVIGILDKYVATTRDVNASFCDMTVEQLLARPGSNRPPVTVGGILVDDAHSCLSIARKTVMVSRA